MGDIHNIAGRAKQSSKSQSIVAGEIGEVQNLLDWIEEAHPTLKDER